MEQKLPLILTRLLACFLFCFQVMALYAIPPDEYKASLFTHNTPTLADEIIKTHPNTLLRAARYSLQYFRTARPVPQKLTRSAILEKDKISHDQARETLTFLVDTLERDKKNKRKARLVNPKFLKENFEFIKWTSDQKSAKKDNVKLPKWYNKGKLPSDQIKLTSYAIFKHKGSRYKTKQYPHALYEIASKEFSQKLRLLYSRQEIFTGALAKPRYQKHIKPLVWLSQTALEEALMQGSIMILMPSGRKRLFNAYKSNGFAYNKKIKKEKQKKYWFFKELRPKRNEKILSAPITLGGVIFAGDAKHLGLGKVIALRYKNLKTKKNEVRLGILADVGSAFSNNLYQLDFFAGTFNNRDEFKTFIGQFPPSVEVYLLKKKPAPTIRVVKRVEKTKRVTQQKQNRKTWRARRRSLKKYIAKKLAKLRIIKRKGSYEA